MGISLIVVRQCRVGAAGMTLVLLRRGGEGGTQEAQEGPGRRSRALGPARAAAGGAAAAAQELRGQPARHPGHLGRGGLLHPARQRHPRLAPHRGKPSSV